MKYYKLFTLTIFLFIQQVSFAQANNVTMADEMRSNGKIYVVVAVLVTILIGILAYLINTELKLNKLEQEFEDKNK